jgi:hypothetical protein
VFERYTYQLWYQYLHHKLVVNQESIKTVCPTELSDDPLDPLDRPDDVTFIIIFAAENQRLFLTTRSVHFKL